MWTSNLCKLTRGAIELSRQSKMSYGVLKTIPDELSRQSKMIYGSLKNIPDELWSFKLIPDEPGSYQDNPR